MVLMISTCFFASAREMVKRDDGRHTEFYQNGRKKAEGILKGGKKHGYWMEWHPNGEPKHEGEYVEGKHHGLWLSYHENGSVEDEIEFKKKGDSPS